MPKNKDKSIIEINEITARLEIDKKSWATAFANKGVINITEKTAEMVGSVKIKGFEKIQIEASDLKIFYLRGTCENKKTCFYERWIWNDTSRISRVLRYESKIR